MNCRTKPSVGSNSTFSSEDTSSKSDIPIPEIPALEIDYNPSAQRFVNDPNFDTLEKVKGIAPIEAKLHLENKRPPAPTINQKIDQLNLTLEQIRLGQFR